MDITIPIPGDADGFISRECGSCEERFKWFLGTSEDTPGDWVDPDSFYCPLCGVESPNGDFMTVEQIEYVSEIGLQAAMSELRSQLGAIKSPHVSFTSTGGSGTAPSPPFEPEGFVTVASPCHPWEPVKLATVGADGTCCLVCGSRFYM